MVARLVWAVIAGFLVTGFAAAQSNPPQNRTAKMDRHFSYTDTNGDGFISREEAAQFPALMKRFAVIDTDKDGKLSREEMQADRLGTRSKQRTANAGRKARTTEGGNNDAFTRADADDTDPAPRKNFQ